MQATHEQRQRVGLELATSRRTHRESGLQLEEFTYDDAIVRLFLLAMYGWGVVAFLVGIYVALQLA